MVVSVFLCSLVALICFQDPDCWRQGGAVWENGKNCENHGCTLIRGGIIMCIEI